MRLVRGDTTDGDGEALRFATAAAPAIDDDAESASGDAAAAAAAAAEGGKSDAAANDWLVMQAQHVSAPAAPAL
jgi:hypothetical protein